MPVPGDQPDPAAPRTVEQSRYRDAVRRPARYRGRPGLSGTAGRIIFMSFQDWPLFGPPSPNGLDNYASIATNKLFLGAITFTLIYTLLTVVIFFVVSFLLVAVSNTSRRGVKFYRTAFFLPYVIGTASAALIWFVSINDQNGIANSVPRELSDSRMDRSVSWKRRRRPSSP